MAQTDNSLAMCWDWIHATISYWLAYVAINRHLCYENPNISTLPCMQRRAGNLVSLSGKMMCHYTGNKLCLCSLPHCNWAATKGDCICSFTVSRNSRHFCDFCLCLGHAWDRTAMVSALDGQAVDSRSKGKGKGLGSHPRQLPQTNPMSTGTLVHPDNPCNQWPST